VCVLGQNSDVGEDETIPLLPEAIAILRVFADKGSKVGDVIHFTDFGEAIIWDKGGIRDERIRSGLQELISGRYVIKYEAGLGITTKGLKEIPNKVPTSLIGAAGEHFVMFQLYRRGLMVGQPPQGVADVDLLVLDERAQIMKNIQVKTRSKGSDGGWHMKTKHERLVSDRLWYVFVDMEQESPVCYVVPSAVVARVVRESHSTWLSLPAKNGQVHRDSDMRRVRPRYPFELPDFPDNWLDQYRERWDLLKD